MHVTAEVLLGSARREAPRPWHGQSGVRKMGPSYEPHASGSMSMDVLEGPGMPESDDGMSKWMAWAGKRVTEQLAELGVRDSEIVGIEITVDKRR